MESAAAAIAFASITIQLTEQIRKLRDLWQSCRDAVDDVGTGLQDLKGLSSLLSRIRDDERRHGLDPTTADPLKICEKRVATAVAMLESLSHGLQSHSRGTRKWTAIKTAFKKEKVKEFRDSICHIEVTLVLARQQQSK